CGSVPKFARLKAYFSSVIRKLVMTVAGQEQWPVKIEIVAAQSNALPAAAAGSSFGICCRFNLFSLFMDSICAKADVAVFRLRRARFRLTRRRTRGRNAS